MNDDQELAPEGVGDEVVVEAEQVETDEGQDEIQPAEEQQDDAESEEKSKSAERRERRKQALERIKAEGEDAAQRARESEARLDAMRNAVKELPKPKQADFKDYDEYTAALSAFHSVQAMDTREMRRLEAEAKQHFESVEAVKKQQTQEDAQNWVSQMEEARGRYTDFDAVALSEDNVISRAMAAQIVQSDHAADIAYHLGKNPDLGKQMATMTEVQMARAIGRLEAQISAPKPKTVTTAPDPIAPLRGKATASKDPDKMTPAEYRDWREKGGSF